MSVDKRDMNIAARKKQEVTFYPTPRHCQVCGEHLGDVMYDARLPSFSGKWGCICQECFDVYGCSLGQGHGQKYERQESGSFVLTEGGSNGTD